MKNLLFACFALALTTTSFAQDLKIGVLGGGNLFSLTQTIDPEPDDFEAVDALGFGYQAGLFVDVPLNDRFELHLEGLYQVRSLSSETETQSTILGVDFLTKLNTTNTDAFFQAPILAGFKVNDMLTLRVGPSFGILLSSNQSYETETTIGGVTTTDSGEEESTDGRNAFEAGLCFGGQINFSDNLSLGLTYSRAFTDFFEETSFEGTDFSTKYGGVQLNLLFALSSN